MSTTVTTTPLQQLRLSTPRIGLALGGGGARGLAHLLMLEAFDELGVRPAAIAGTSIGAIYGAAFASGLSAKLIRAHTEEALSQRFDLVRQLYSARAEPIAKLFRLLPMRAALLDPVALLDIVLPSKVPATFAGLDIPLAIVATDFYAQEQVTITSGPLRKAIGASMALPALFQPVLHEGRTLMDGGLVNPLPFDLLVGAVDLTVAIDVSGGAHEPSKSRIPGATEVLFSATQILQRSIVREKLKSSKPDVYIDVAVDQFHVLEFHRLKEILAAAAPAKEELKRELARILSAGSVEPAPPAPAEPARIEPEPKPRRLLPRRKKA